MKLQHPKVPSKAHLLPLDITQLEPEAHLERGCLMDVVFVQAEGRNMHFETLILERCLFTTAVLERLSAQDIIWKACDLSAVRGSESSLFRMHVQSGRIVGIDWSRSTFRDVVFEDCKLDMANFRFATLQRVTFKNCHMRETDFQGASLVDVSFPGSILDKVAFDQSKVTRVDAREAQLYDIRGWHSLSGIIVDSAQLMSIAPQLALAMGLKVTE